MSALELPDSMANQGPKMWDGVITYEHVALPYLERADTYSKNLMRMAVIYPRPTLVARHPAVIISSDPAQQDAAQRWLRFLQSKPMQYHAITLGFRPTNPEVSLRDPVVEMNYFLRLRRYGISPAPRILEVPVPSGATLNELTLLWSDATGRK
jgi:ABC-type sulfate transport system substrate-binding protein